MSIVMPAMMNKSKNSDVYNEIRKAGGKSMIDVDDKVMTSTMENKRRAKVNTCKYLDLLAKGYPPYKAKLLVGATNPSKTAMLYGRVKKLIEKYQARKIEELVFLAEIRHSYIYKTALGEFEKSKIDPKTGKKRPGNVAYLQMANECIRDMRKLLGLDKGSGDIINNGNLAMFNWDSLHNRQGNVPQSLTNGQSVVSSSQEIARVDPVEERIRQLEQLAAQKKRENDEAIEEHGLPEDDHKDSEPVEIIQRKIVLKAVKPVKQEIGHKECAVLQSSVSLDDLIG